MLDKLSGVFTLRGYMKILTTRPEAQIVLKITAEGIRFLCLIDDTENVLTPGAVSRLLESARQYIQGNEKLSHYAGEMKGLALIITNDPAHTRSLLSEGDTFWLIHQPARRLMIYDDQPGEFGDARSCVEEYLNQNALRMMLASAKELFSPVNIGLIVVNILIFVLMEIFGSTEDAGYMINHGALSVHEVLQEKEYFRLITSAFLHFGTAHLLYNMISLLYLGKPLEHVLGSTRYLIFYLICAVGASCASLGWHSLHNEIYTVSAGASGAICGVAGGLAYVMLRNRKKNKYFNFVRWAIFVALVAGQGIGSEGIDNAAHIGGMIIGFLLAMLMHRI